VSLLRNVQLICVLMILTCVAAFGQNYQEAFSHARDLLRQKQFNEALASARQAIHLDNSRWEGWYVAGTAAVGLAKYDLAIDYFQEALTRAPDSAKYTVNDAIASCRQAAMSQPAVAPSPVAAPVQANMVAATDLLLISTWDVDPTPDFKGDRYEFLLDGKGQRGTQYRFSADGKCTTTNQKVNQCFWKFSDGNKENVTFERSYAAGPMLNGLATAAAAPTSFLIIETWFSCNDIRPGKNNMGNNILATHWRFICPVCVLHNRGIPRRNSYEAGGTKPYSTSG
jgi:hypothetical protein